MIRFVTLLGLVAASMFIIQGCSKTKSNCSFIAPHMVFVGFTKAETDSMIIRRYERNGAFDNLIDTALVTDPNFKRTPVGEDSVIIAPLIYDKLIHELFANDWEIYFPVANRTIRISEVDPKFTKEKQAGSTCHSFAGSLNFNGTPYTFTSWFDTEYRVYEVK